MRKNTVFTDPLLREDEITSENSIDSYRINSTTSQTSRSHKSSECSTIKPNMPNSIGFGENMLDDPTYPKLVLQPPRKKYSIFHKIRDKLKLGSLLSSPGDNDDGASKSTSSPSQNMGIAGILMQTHSGTSLLNPDLTDMLFKSAAVTTSRMPLTGDPDHQECYSDLYQQQQAFSQQSYNTNSKKKSEVDEAEDGAGGIVATTEIASELKIAFTEYSNGSNEIPAREVGYILRTLGKNPTEDEINDLICEAGCEWEGYLTADDFVCVALATMRKDVDIKDDIKAAFDVFDRDGDGKISESELKEAMQRFGHSFTNEECSDMFKQADLNSDGIIDWQEFCEMMAPEDNASKAVTNNDTKDTSIV